MTHAMGQEIELPTWDFKLVSLTVIDNGVARVAAPQIAPSPAPAKDARF